MTSGLTVSGGEGFQVWTLAFPPVNAIDPVFLEALEGRLDALEASEDTAVVVLASRLRVFSAGADARWMAQVVDAEGTDRLLANFKAAMDRFRTVGLRIRRSPVLFVAAIGGHALAG